MSRVDDLVREHCPNGVEYVALGELIAYEQPGKYLVASTAYSPEFATPVLTAGQTFVLGYTDESDGVYPAAPETPVIIFDDFTTAFKWVDFPFKAKSSAMKILRTRAGAPASLRFVWYAMHLIRYIPQNHARHWISTYANFRVPVPPLEVQREIVRILDGFMELESELESELEARRRQYAHYRDALLTFSEAERERESAVRWVTLGELGRFYGGLRGKSKSDFGSGNAPYVSYMNVFGNLATDVAPDTAVRVSENERQNQIERGDVLFTGSSESRDEAGMSSVVTKEPPRPLYLNSFCIGFRPHDATLLEADFAKHLFRSASMRRQIVRTASGVTRFNVSKARLAKVVVPIPEPGKQRRLASILDKFDALVNNLSIGLPAELAARRKQYEHYRDRLLTFEEAA